MRSGRLKEQITFERPAVPNDFGNPTKKPTTLHAGVPCCIEPLKGVEQITAQQVQSRITHKITLRWTPDLAEVLATDRILYGKRTFEIESLINVDERNFWLELMCKETT